MKTFAIGDFIQCPPEHSFYPGTTLKIYDKYPSCFEKDGKVFEHRNTQGEIIYIYRLEVKLTRSQFFRDIPDFQLLQFNPQLIQATTKEPHCCCSSNQLFQSGCRCGAFYQR